MEISKILDLIKSSFFNLSQFIQPSSNLVTLGIVNQVVKAVKSAMQDDLAKLMQKLLIGLIVSSVAVFALISALLSAESLIKPLENGPWIILVSYTLLAASCFTAMYFIFRNQPNKIAETQETETSSPNLDIQDVLLSSLNNFINSAAQSYQNKTEEMDSLKNSKQSNIKDFSQNSDRSPYQADSNSDFSNQPKQPATNSTLTG